MSNLGRFLIITGFLIILIGLILVVWPKIPIFKLPGDIVITKKNLSFYFPIVSSIIISLILTVILNLLLKR